MGLPPRRGERTARAEGTRVAQRRPVVAAASDRPPSRSLCLHCALPVGAGAQENFCCSGCAAVYDLLHHEKLDGFYALRGSRGIPVAEQRGGRRGGKGVEEGGGGI
jgi:hypothetical protein